MTTPNRPSEFHDRNADRLQVLAVDIEGEALIEVTTYVAGADPLVIGLPIEDARQLAETLIRLTSAHGQPVTSTDPMIFNDIRRHPDGQVRVYSREGRLVAGQSCRQVVAP